MQETLHFPFDSNPENIGHLLRCLDRLFPYYAYFENNGITYPHNGFPRIIHAAQKAIDIKDASVFFGQKDLVAIVSYDYKNRLEKLESKNLSLLDCPETLFFIPELTIHFAQNGLDLVGEKAGDLVLHLKQATGDARKNEAVSIQVLTTAEEYATQVQAIRQHIEEGDIYEMNYCMAFGFGSPSWDPISGFLSLMAVSPMPFSAFFRAKEKYLLCASPERFVKKEHDRLIAQPIKGTIKRGNSPQEDRDLAAQLLHSEKERAENLMIVDLMRNDLSRISQVGSVEVEELFGVYPFPKVHQMISTVVSKIKVDTGLSEIFRATFPMGSMTGAPKIKCMELIDAYENFKRGWFSGTLGIISANGDFDFNVIIRSIIFDKELGKGYFAVGSAITYDADPAYEYEECLLKSSAIREVLGGN